MFRISRLKIMKKDVFPTLVAIVQTPIIFDKKLEKFRNISIFEVMKLQSFPKKFKPNINKYQAVKQLGNSVNVIVIRELARTFIQ